MILTRQSVSGQPQPRTARALRTSLALGVWLLAALAVQSTVDVDIARSLHDDEERLELQIRGRHEPPANVAAPPRTNEESIDPWELVSV